MPTSHSFTALGGRGRALLAVICIIGAGAAAGCGSSSTQSSSIGVVTRSGLRYTYSLTVHNGQACSSQTYAGTGPKGKPLRQTARYCGPSGQAVPPTLIQVATPRAALILDRPSTCGVVRIGRGRRPLSPAKTKCSASDPHLRLTVLPAGRAVAVEGIPGVRTVGLATLPCTFICTRQLPHQG